MQVRDDDSRVCDASCGLCDSVLDSSGDSRCLIMEPLSFSALWAAYRSLLRKSFNTMTAPQRRE